MRVEKPVVCLLIQEPQIPRLRKSSSTASASLGMTMLWVWQSWNRSRRTYRHAKNEFCAFAYFRFYRDRSVVQLQNAVSHR